MISIPENLGDFKVLSVEIIDRIFNSLKQMVEEDISDLMRRQRHRDEKWRSIMQPNIVALTNFSQNFNAELADQNMDIKEKQSLQALDQMSQAVQLVEEQSRQNLRAVQDTSAEVIAKEVENRHRHEKWRKELEDEVTKLRTIITEQQTTMISQQKALSQASGALEDARRDKDSTLARAALAANESVEQAALKARSQAEIQFDQERKVMQGAIARNIRKEAASQIKSQEEDAAARRATSRKAAVPRWAGASPRTGGRQNREIPAPKARRAQGGLAAAGARIAHQSRPDGRLEL